MRALKRPEYAEIDPDGTLVALYCKVCGTAVGGIEEVVKRRRLEGDKTVETAVVKFSRFSNYAETTLLFDDGSKHVTNGCFDCLSQKLSKAIMRDLYEADVAMLGRQGADNDALERLRARRVRRMNVLRRPAKEKDSV